jgi:hypothetical protein
LFRDLFESQVKNLQKQENARNYFFRFVGDGRVILNILIRQFFNCYSSFEVNKFVVIFKRAEQMHWQQINLSAFMKFQLNDCLEK